MSSMKLQERGEAIELRRQGYTLNEIAKQVGVAKSSISLWVRNISLPNTARERITSLQTAGQRAARESRLNKTRAILLEARREAEGAIGGLILNREMARIACSLLYWCEGAKAQNDKTMRFSNSDPALIRCFVALIRKAFVLDEHKFRIRMHLHEYHNEVAQREFWSTITKIPTSRFSPTYWKPHTKKTLREGYPGCVHIDYYDVVIARKIYATARAFLGNVVN